MFRNFVMKACLLASLVAGIALAQSATAQTVSAESAPSALFANVYNSKGGYFWGQATKFNNGSVYVSGPGLVFTGGQTSAPGFVGLGTVPVRSNTETAASFDAFGYVITGNGIFFASAEITFSSLGYYTVSVTAYLPSGVQQINSTVPFEAGSYQFK